jgi:hypothetical protein
MTAPEHIRRNGWMKVDGKWIPSDLIEPRKLAVEGDIDVSLEATHERFKRALALQSRRLELAAETPEGLRPEEVAELSVLSMSWSRLTQHEPAGSLEDLTEQQVRDQLAAVKARAK